MDYDLCASTKYWVLILYLYSYKHFFLISSRYCFRFFSIRNSLFIQQLIMLFGMISSILVRYYFIQRLFNLMNLLKFLNLSNTTQQSFEYLIPIIIQMQANKTRKRQGKILVDEYEKIKIQKDPNDFKKSRQNFKQQFSNKQDNEHLKQFNNQSQSRCSFCGELFSIRLIASHEKLCQIIVDEIAQKKQQEDIYKMKYTTKPEQRQRQNIKSSKNGNRNGYAEENEYYFNDSIKMRKQQIISSHKKQETKDNRPASAMNKNKETNKYQKNQSKDQHINKLTKNLSKSKINKAENVIRNNLNQFKKQTPQILNKQRVSSNLKKINLPKASIINNDREIQSNNLKKKNMNLAYKMKKQQVPHRQKNKEYKLDMNKNRVEEKFEKAKLEEERRPRRKQQKRLFFPQYEQEQMYDKTNHKKQKQQKGKQKRNIELEKERQRERQKDRERELQRERIRQRERNRQRIREQNINRQRHQQHRHHQTRRNPQRNNASNTRGSRQFRNHRQQQSTRGSRNNQNHNNFFDFVSQTIHEQLELMNNQFSMMSNIYDNISNFANVNIQSNNSGLSGYYQFSAGNIQSSDYYTTSSDEQDFSDYQDYYQDETQSEGLNDDQLEQIKEIKYKASIHGANQCTICLSDLTNNQVVKQLPCDHIFHSDCINEWLRRKSACPVCRDKLRG